MKSYKKVCSISGHKTVPVEERMKSYKKVCSISGHKTVPVKERMKSYKSKSNLILEAAMLVDTKLSQLKKG